jgi:hypothetical protein
LQRAATQRKLSLGLPSKTVLLFRYVFCMDFGIVSAPTEAKHTRNVSSEKAVLLESLEDVNRHIKNSILIDCIHF